VAVVRHVAVGHQQAAVTHGNGVGEAGGAVDGDKLADGVAVANDDTCRLAVVLEVLRIGAHTAEWKMRLPSPISVSPSTMTFE
jgi:hypothetical protein